MKFLNHNLFTGDITVNGTTTLSTATGVTRATGDNTTHLATTAFVKAQDYATNTALGNYVPISRTLTINNVTYDLSANRSWTIGTADYTSTVKHVVKAGVAVTKGQAVYVTSADGTNMIVGLASNASEATSSKTMGLLDATVSANGFANVVTEGLLAGLDTSAAGSEGDPVWLGTNGNLIYGLLNKPYAPAHLVFIGIVTRKNANNGEIFVKVQNGFELNEIHDVDLKTIVPVNGHILGFDGTLWVNKTIAAWLGYTPANASGTTNYISKFTGSTTLGNSLIYDNGTGVGIGTTDITAGLHVNYSAANTLLLQRISDDSGPPEAIGRKARGTLNAKTGVTANDRLWFFAAAGYIGTEGVDGAWSSNKVGMNFVASENWTSAAQGTHITWATTEIGQTTRTDKMILTGAGNLGIGTTSPSYKLDVNGETRLGKLITTWSNSPITPSAVMYSESGYNTVIGGNGQFSTSYLALMTTGNMIYSGGNVGIGTTSPVTKLEVDGTVTISGPSAVKWKYSDNYAYFGIGYISGADYGFYNYNYGRADLYIQQSTGNVGIGTALPSNKLQVANGDMSITSGYSFILADTDTNWRLGRNIITPVESVYLNSNTFEFVAANASDQGWQFINDDGYPVLEIGAATGSRNVWVNAGNLLVPTGSVGIGTTSPTQILHLARTGTDNYIKVDAGGQASNYSGIMLSEAGINYGWTLRHSALTDLLYISYQDNTPTFTDAVTFNRSGNVGIGTGTPSEKLHVDGRARITTIDNGTGDFATISGTGVITRRTAAQVLSDIGAQPSGSYLTAEADTLATVTARGATTNTAVNFGANGGAVNLTGLGSHMSFKDQDNVWTGYVGFDGNTGRLEFPGRNVRIVSGYNGTIELNTGVSGYNSGRIHIPQGYLSVDSNYVAATAFHGQSIKVGTAGSTPTVDYGIFHHSGVGLGIASGAGGSTQGISFWSHNGSSYFESVRIAGSTGNMGVGTTLPDNKLTVKGDNALVDVQSTADGQTVGFLARYLNNATLGGAFRYTTGDAQLYIDNLFNGNNGVYSDINIRNCDTGGTLRNRIKIKGSSGYIGINNTEPSTQLHVGGVITATGGNSTNWNTAYGWGNHTNLYLPLGGGTLTGDLNLNYGYPRINFYDSGNNPDYSLINNDGDFSLYDITNNVHRFWVSAIGNVGISVTSPSYKLHVDGVAQSTIAKFYTSDNNYSTVEVGDTGDVFASVYMSSNSGNGQLYKYGSGWGAESGMVALYSSNGPITLQAGGSTKVFVASGGSVGIGTTSSVTNSLLSVAGGINTTTGVIGYNTADFFTFNGKAQPHYGFNLDPTGSSPIGISGYFGIALATNGAERFRILNNGYVGIGITSPANKLSIGSTQDGGIDFLYDSTNNYKNQIKNYWNSSTDTRMDFNIGNSSGATPVTIMSVGYGSNVGIGTTSPSTKLDVNGVITATGGNSTQWNTAYGWGNHASQGYATQTYVNTAIANLVDSAPSTLDTLNELAAALGDDPNFATTVTNSIAAKLPLAGGTMTGTIYFANDMGTALQGTIGDNDFWRIRGGNSGSNAGFLEIATSDDGTEPIYVRQYTGVFSSLTRTATLLDGSGNTSLPGSLTVGGTITENSSIRYKENVVNLESATEKVEQLRAVRYNKIGHEIEEIGLIAEEVAEVYPEVVNYNEEGQPDGVNYTRLSVILLKALQEQNAVIASLSERINKLESK